jgi:ParB family chromosome partitioning protein
VITKKPVRGLGRGLDALLPVRDPPRPSESGESYGEHGVFRCALDKIRPQPGQPRRYFDQERLDELADSIREHGLIEPLVVRRVGADNFELIAGERRWRAAQKAGLRELLVVVREVSTKQAYELALIENVQREDLNPIEFAEALERLLEEHAYTQETLAQRVGKDRSTIANALRLLRLPAEVRDKVAAGELSEGHARALLGAPDDASRLSLAGKVLRGHLSVRQTEALVRSAKAAHGQKPGEAPSGKPGKSVSVRDLEQRLERKLGTRIEVKDKGKKGQLLIHYSSLDELDRILEILL